MRENYFKKLVGKTVVSYNLSDDDETLSLIFDDGKIASLVTYGDCCSSTWIESIDMPDNLLGTIQSMENLDMPDLGNIGTPKRTNVDEVSYYGLKIVTNKGHVVIDYRNDSNGYYGGDLELQGLE